MTSPEAVYTFLAVVVTSLVAPSTLAFFTNRALERKSDKEAEQRRMDKEADWKREDEVAKRAEKAAADLINSNKAVAKLAADNAEKVMFGLERIHTLVNSDMTAARSEQRDQARLTLTGLRKIIKLDEDAGREPSQDDLDAIDAAEKTIKKLDTILADRLAQQRKVEQQQKDQNHVEQSSPT